MARDYLMEYFRQQNEAAPNNQGATTMDYMRPAGGDHPQGLWRQGDILVYTTPGQAGGAYRVASPDEVTHYNNRYEGKVAGQAEEARKNLDPTTSYIDKQIMGGNTDYNDYVNRTSVEASRNLPQVKQNYGNAKANQIAMSGASNARSNMVKSLTEDYGRRTNVYQDLLNRRVRADLQQDASNKQQESQDEQSKRARNAAIMGIIGTGIGAYYGGPTGAAIGGGIGSYAGAGNG